MPGPSKNIQTELEPLKNDTVPVRFARFSPLWAWFGFGLTLVQVGQCSHKERIFLTFTNVDTCTSMIRYDTVSTVLNVDRYRPGIGLAIFGL